VISGELELQLEFETTVLRAGDSLCFDSATPHLYVNRGEVQAQGLWSILGRGVLDQGAALGREPAGRLRSPGLPFPAGPPLGFPDHPAPARRPLPSSRCEDEAGRAATPQR